MHKILTIAVISSSILLASCGNSSVKKDDSLEGKKAQLTALKDQQDKLGKQISTLETELSKLDTASAVAEKAKLVTLTQLAPTGFTHYIDLQGNVDAENTSYISPRGSGGVVRAVYVKQGDAVRQGQLLLKLDDAIQRQTLVNAQTQLAYAKDIYQRRKNLWDQKIGAEVDLINAKNQVDQTESQLKIAQEQLDFTNVTADISGVVDYLSIKVGESFTPGAAQIRIINTSNLKVIVQVPETYQERVRVGTPVKIEFPGLNNKEISGTVKVAGKLISASRSFQVEIRIPNDKDIRSNQLAVVRLQDYTAKNVITAPVNTLQTDEKGKYVMVGTNNKGKWYAHKRTVTIGQPYADKIEITSGLQTGDQLITDGFQGLYEGQLITTQ
ncbi:MAG TPA: efflux RND transporter periplasmic adaptor subunit [Puia sp.]|nr:efflux RND transporter periplasmic adaptor subunit [Puia sp.]